jgi:aspartyl-tRNA(Asn)/glutamyl-tRNA(Gln) amidotransferase subunit A
LALPPEPLSHWQAELAAGRTTSRALTEQALDAARNGSEAATTFIALHADTALATAGAIDSLRAAGVPLPPLAGIPITVKDLFDQAGQVTRAGSRVLAGAPAAPSDSAVVQRLRAAGMVIVGRTNMTEFAYSGLGLNPHYGTPRNRGTAPPAASRAVPLRVRRFPSPTAWLPPRSAATPAARCAFRRRCAA